MAGALKIGRKGCGTFRITSRVRRRTPASIRRRGQRAGRSRAPGPGHRRARTARARHDGDPDRRVRRHHRQRRPGRGEHRGRRPGRDRHRGRTDRAAFATLAPHLDGATITVEGEVDRPPMPVSASAELFALAQRLLPGLEGTRVGGGSDGNFTAALGVPTLDGLGAVGGGAHADHEYLVVDAMPRASGRSVLVARAPPLVPTRDPASTTSSCRRRSSARQPRAVWTTRRSPSSRRRDTCCRMNVRTRSSSSCAAPRPPLPRDPGRWPLPWLSSEKALPPWVPRTRCAPYPVCEDDAPSGGASWS
jgi:hypothetical protein